MGISLESDGVSAFLLGIGSEPIKNQTQSKPNRIKCNRIKTKSKRIDPEQIRQQRLV